MKKYILTLIIAVALAIAAAVYLVNGDGAAPEPPELTVESGGELFHGVEGRYCWRNTQTGNARCVDKIGPAELVENHNTAITSSQGGLFQIHVENYREPQSYRYTVFKDNNTPFKQGEGKEFSLNITPGMYILGVSATWEEGDSNYFFPLKIE